MKHHAKFAVVTAAVLLFTAACGTGGSGDKLKDIQDSGTWVVGTSGNNKPTIFRNTTGDLVGTDADWANLIAKDLGVKVEWKILDFKGIVPGLQANQFDSAMSGLRVTEERKKVIDFSDPIGSDEAVAVFRSGNNGIKSPNDIAGKSVCVVAGSSNGAEPVKRIGTAKSVKAYPGQAEAFADLSNGRCEVMVTGRLLAADWIKSGEGKGYELSAGGTDCASFAVGVPKGSDKLLQAINNAIDKETKNGALDEIARKWLGEPFPDCSR